LIVISLNQLNRIHESGTCRVSRAIVDRWSISDGVVLADGEPPFM